ncbi:MAG: phosphocarrier protein HPr [Gemmatimonadetes bacterium]|nr:phosphocarrier protein HPr [Gemmatimonadota bacterium]
MIVDELTVLNPLGVHLRPAGKIVTLCSSFKSEIFFLRDGKEANAKSILGVIALAAAEGSKIAVRIDGEDEAEARYALKELFEQRFGEY